MIIHPEFKSHKLKANAIEKINHSRELFDNFLTELEKLLDDGRYLSLVRTHLETASFFMHKGISQDVDNREDEKDAA